MRSLKKLMLASFLTMTAVSANASADFAGPYCESGCRLIDNIKSSGDQIYYGTVAKSYRVCHDDTYSLHLTVDGQTFDVPDGNNKNRDCADVSGTSISIAGNGAAWVGPIGQ